MEPEAAVSESKYAKPCAMLPTRTQNFSLTSCEIDTKPVLMKGNYGQLDQKLLLSADLMGKNDLYQLPNKKKFKNSSTLT